MSRHWDEDKVGEWLKRINCAQYVELFKRTSPLFLPAPNPTHYSPLTLPRSQPHQWREPDGDGPDPPQGHGHQESW